MRRLLAAAFLSLVAFQSAAQFPSKTVRLIVGFPPSGAADVTIRIIALGLSAQIGQPVVVENRPGAESVIAANGVGKDSARTEPEVRLATAKSPEHRYAASKNTA